jgi:hypothetical protein
MNIAGFQVKTSSLVYVLCSLAGVAAFAYSLLQMTAIQAQMNRTMGTINTSVASTGSIVDDTAKALQPLTSTTQALARIEQRQVETANHLAAMNNHLRNIGVAESSIISLLDSLNQTESQIIGQLSDMAAVNQQLLQKSQQSTAQAWTEANRVGEINAMTTTSIAEMRALNHKLRALRLVP